MKLPKRLHRLISFFLSLTLVFQTFSPAIIFAEEATQSADIQTEEITPTPTEIPTPEVTSELTPSPIEAPTPIPTQKPLWTEVDSDTIVTNENVGEEIDYRFRDTNLIVRFTKLTQPGKLTIRQVKLTPEQIASTGALSDTAYDITSDMENGSFLYDLTLPLPQDNPNAKVEFASDQNSLDQSVTIDTNVTKTPDTIEIRDLDHFTIFFVSGGVDQATHGDMCVLYDCTLDADHPGLRSVDSQYLDISSFDASVSAYWPDSEEAIPDGDSYVQFDFSPNLDPDILVQKASLKFVYKTNEIDTSDPENKPYGAKLVVSSDGFSEEELFIRDVTPNPANPGDQSFGIDLLPEFQNSNDLNNLQVRLYLFGTAVDDPGVTTGFNQVALIIPPPTPELVSPPDGALIKASDAILDWTDVADVLGEPVTYYYRSSWTGGSYPSDFATGVARATSSIDARGSASRTYNWQVRACAGLDNCSDWSGPWEVTIDGTRPTTPGTPLTSPNPTNQTTQVWNWSASTDSNGIFQYLWEVIGGPSGTVSDTTLTTNLGEGIWSFSVKAEDNPGNQSLVSTGGVTVDRTGPPAPTITFPGAEQYFRTSPISNRWTAVVDPSGIKEYRIEYQYDDGHTFSGAPYRTTTSTSRNHFPGITEQGGVMIRVQALDNAGNYGDWSDWIHYYYDATAPALLSKTTFSGWYREDQVSEFTYTDANRIASGTPVSCTISSEGTDQTCSVTPNVCDAAGNCNTVTVISNGADLDKSVPTVDAGPDRLVKEIFTQVGSGSDSISGIASYSWSKESGAGDLTFGSPNEPTTTVTADQDGVYEISLTVTDNAGNSTPDTFTLTWDATGPTANIISPANGSYKKSKPTFDVSASDDSGVASVKFQYRLSGGADFTDLNTDTTPSPYRAKWGGVTLTTNNVYDLRAIATDTLGNLSFTPIVSFTFDNQLPEILYNNPLGGETVWYNSSPLFNIDFLYDEGGAPLDYAQYRLNGGSYKNIFTADRTSNYTTDWGIASWATLTEGLHQLDIRLRDKAGNTNTDNYVEDVSGLNVGKDLTVPVITVPENQILEAESGAGAIYEFSPAPSVSDDRGTSGVTCDYASGETFPIGTTTVTCEATDLAGNTGSASFDITVEDNIKPTSIITSPANNGTNSLIYSNSWDGSILGTAADDESGLARVELSIQRTSDGKYFDGEGWTEAGEDEPRVTADGTENWSYTLIPPAEDSYEITSHAVDNAGNVEDSYNLTIVFDKTIPEVMISLDPATPDSGNNWYKTEPTIILSATDNTVTDLIEYQWDSTVGVWTVYALPMKTPGEGSHTLYYRAFDKAGNVSDTGIKNIKYDKTELTNGPNNVSVSPNPTSDTTAKVKWDAASDNVGIEKYEINWSLDGTSTSYTDTVGNEVRKHEINKLDQEGKWNITVTAFDAAGNRKAGSVELTVDRSAPIAPTLSLGGTGVGTATLTWNKIVDANDYIIWYGNVSGIYLYGARTGDVDNFTVRGLGGGDYYFVIQSVDNAGNRSGNSNEVNTLGLAGAPGVKPGTPAEGFTPEVKGETTTETPTPTASLTPEVLGETNKYNFPWWMTLLLISSGGYAAWLFLRRR